MCQRRISKGAYTQLANYHICNAFQKRGYNTRKLGGNLLGNSVAMPTAIASSRGKLFLNVWAILSHNDSTTLMWGQTVTWQNMAVESEWGWNMYATCVPMNVMLHTYIHITSVLQSYVHGSATVLSNRISLHKLYVHRCNPEGHAHKCCSPLVFHRQTDRQTGGHMGSDMLGP